ncbi:MAG: hypothetical protein K2V38_07370, partial [Gemmataceae bacterium]|nr:hypothetical protein [Gemmataceae bacterium]
REEGRPHRVAVSEDGARIRREADGPEFGTAAAASVPGGNTTVVEYPFDERVTVRVEAGEGNTAAAENGWVTVAVVLPDGSCREDQVLLSVRDIYKVSGNGGNDQDVLYVQVRGLTGSARVIPNPFAGRNR